MKIVCVCLLACVESVGGAERSVWLGRRREKIVELRVEVWLVMLLGKKGGVWWKVTFVVESYGD